MRAEFGTRPENVIGGIGPGILASCYEVDEPAAAPFREAFGGRFIKPVGERFLVDLPGAIEADLAAAGVRSIHVIRRCTHCEADAFYSYRRDGPKTGRVGLLGQIRKSW